MRRTRNRSTAPRRPDRSQQVGHVPLNGLNILLGQVIDHFTGDRPCQVIAHVAPQQTEKPWRGRHAQGVEAPVKSVGIQLVGHLLGEADGDLLLRVHGGTHGMTLTAKMVESPSRLVCLERPGLEPILRIHQVPELLKGSRRPSASKMRARAALATTTQVFMENLLPLRCPVSPFRSVGYLRSKPAAGETLDLITKVP